MGSELKKSTRLPAIRIVAIYALFSTAWIYFSDYVLNSFVHDQNAFLLISVFKGFLFVVVTAAILYRLISREIAKRQQVMQNLALEAERRRILFEQSGDGIVVFDKNGKVFEANQQFSVMLGYPLTELLQLHVWDWDARWSREILLQKIQSADEPCVHFETRHRRKDGSVYDVEITGNRTEWGGQKLFFSVCRDITARKRAAEVLLETTHRLELATASAHLAIWDWDARTDEFFWDDRMYKLYGIERGGPPLRLQTWKKMLHPDDVPRVIAAREAAMMGKGDYDTEFRIMRPDGSIRIVKVDGIVLRDENGKALRIIGVNRDITEQKKLEEKIRQSQKIEIVGQLAGGVAHDFNNILTAIIGYANLLLMKLEPGDPSRGYVDQILASSERAADLTHSLLAFSRNQVINPVLIDINKVVADIKKILERVIGEDVQLKVTTSDKPLTVRVDKSQIEHVLMNLATNARDAMPRGGVLRITTEQGTIAGRFVENNLDDNVENYAVITVSDDGSGMDKATQERIFEPFFTTKEVGKGTGLGLAMVYGAVKQHNGFINVYSEPGLGSIFKIYLPLAGMRAPAAQKKKMPPPTGTETILLIEDDSLVRQVTKQMMESFGYSVIESLDGPEAIALFRAQKDRIDLVVSDMIMPKMNGKEVYYELKKIKPDVKILFVSGYTADILAERGFEDQKFNFIAKPLNPHALSIKLRDVLDLEG